jgi:tellurite resistance protein TerC
MWMRTLAQARRLIKMVIGFTLLAAGVAMLVLPGPGIVAILVALAILSAEFMWARLLLERIKRLGPNGSRQQEGTHTGP